MLGCSVAVGWVFSPAAAAQVPISIDARTPLAALGATTFDIRDEAGGSIGLNNLSAAIVHDLLIATGTYMLVPSVGPNSVTFKVDPPPLGCMPTAQDPCCGIVTLPTPDTAPPAPPTGLTVQ